MSPSASLPSWRGPSPPSGAGSRPTRRRPPATASSGPRPSGPAARRPAAGVGAAPGGGQHGARPPAAGGKTPAQHRRGLRLQKLPRSFEVPTGKLPLAAGRVTFIRRVSVAGTVKVLSQVFRVGKRHRGLYLRLVVDTKRGWLTAYLNGRVLKRWPYKLLND